MRSSFLSRLRTRRVALRSLLLALAVSAVTAGSSLASGGGVAYAPPGFSWGAASKSKVYTIGWDKKYKKNYHWEAAGDVMVCVQVWGIDAAHPKGAWFGGGCGMSGYTTVPWGNTAGYGKLRAHSVSFLGSFVPWDD